MAKIDRRFVKSESVILKALTSLLNKYDYEEISISDLVEEADINKSTFYLHYTSLNQVLRTLQDRLLTEMFEVYQSNEGDIKSFISKLLDNAKKNRKIFRTVIYNSNHYFYENAYSLFWGVIPQGKTKNKHIDTALHRRLSLLKCVGSSILLWCQEGCVTPKEEVEQLLISNISFFLE